MNNNTHQITTDSYVYNCKNIDEYNQLRLKDFGYDLFIVFIGVLVLLIILKYFSDKY